MTPGPPASDITTWPMVPSTAEPRVTTTLISSTNRARPSPLIRQQEHGRVDAKGVVATGTLHASRTEWKTVRGLTGRIIDRASVLLRATCSIQYCQYLDQLKRNQVGIPNSVTRHWAGSLHAKGHPVGRRRRCRCAVDVMRCATNITTCPNVRHPRAQQSNVVVNVKVNHARACRSNVGPSKRHPYFLTSVFRASRTLKKQLLVCREGSRHCEEDSKKTS
jgi:hypothetical protein